MPRFLSTAARYCAKSERSEKIMSNMSKYTSIATDNNPRHCAGWDEAIQEAERQIADAKERIRGLKMSVETFRRLRDRGMSFPVNGGDNASTHI